MDYPLLHTEEALARFGGNSMVLKTLLKKFPGMATPLMDELSTLIQAHDYTKAEHVAHTLKGTAGNLSLSAFFHVATELDLELKANTYNEDTYARFIQIFHDTLVFVNEYIASQ